jgi:hypothetical protein
MSEYKSLKDDFDRYIGKGNLVTTEDRMRFQQWKQGIERKSNKYWLPRIATMILLIGISWLGFVAWTNQSSHPLEQGADTENVAPIPPEQIRQTIEDIDTAFHVGMTKEEVEAALGKRGIYFTGESEVDGTPFEALEFHFLGSWNN